jgi:hypothetical protein
LGKIRENIKSPGGFLEGLPERLGGFLAKKAGPLADQFLSRVPEEKRRPLLFCLGGIVVLLLCLVVITLAVSLGGGREGGVQEALEPAIPSEELFFPGEPDFVPPLLLEREPRRFWTADDAAPFWEDPGKLGRDHWRREMELVIDNLMESVP